MGNVKIPYYVVIKGRGYWRPKKEMQAFGFQRANCGKDGPFAWAIAETWARRWEQARRGDCVFAPQESNSSKVYPPGSIGEAFQRFRRTVEWAKKAPRTREDWERAWQHLEPSISDIIPPTISLEDMSAIRADIEARISSREATVSSRSGGRSGKWPPSMKYCDRAADPSLGIRNSAPAPRQALWGGRVKLSG
jgi:hypothetical protein